MVNISHDMLQYAIFTHIRFNSVIKLSSSLPEGSLREVSLSVVHLEDTAPELVVYSSASTEVFTLSAVEARKTIQALEENATGSH